MKKVLITAGVHPVMAKRFREKGFVVEVNTDLTTEEVKKIIGDYHGVIVKSNIRIDSAFIDQAAKLEFIGRPGSGLETIDVAYAQSKGIAVHRSPEGNCNAVAEHALGMLLALINNFRQGEREVRQNIWRREANRGIELEGRTVGIWGFGNTGSTFAKKLSGMGVNILAYDKYKTGFADDLDYVTEVTPKEIYEQAEILSFHIPLTEETKHLAKAPFFEGFKQLKILINTSRGGIVKTQDIVAYLEEKKLFGACLDVFENEKPPTFTEEEEKIYKRLFALENVVVTPHVAGWTHEGKYKMATVLLDKIFKHR